jgi:hypothetical protein
LIDDGITKSASRRAEYDLKGKFGFYRFGTTHNIGVPPLNLLPAPTHIAAVGSIEFDGKGGTLSTQHTSRNGLFDPNPPGTPPTVFPTPSPGTYAVSSNTLTLFLGGSPISQGVILNVNEPYLMSLNAGAAVELIAKRMT